MAAYRRAGGRNRTDQILPLDNAGGYPAHDAGRHDEIALAHRTGLRGIEKRTRPRAFRGARLARLPPSRDALYRGLWIPNPRESGLFPLRLHLARKTSPFRKSATTRLPQSDRSATSKTRSRQFGKGWWSLWRKRSTVVHVASASRPQTDIIVACDAVELSR